MESLLESIDSPIDLRKLSKDQLPRLAEEIRELIITVLSGHPGHLSSNLGVVELTIALHYVFDFLRDRLVWDVGHQAYTHKILTGRRERFNTLREKDGISGFADKRESNYDTFTFGHTGTSISTALGLVCGYEATEEKRRVVAVIGDGAMASGMPFEGMNHAGSISKNLILVVNDNKMSISQSVGAISRYLTKIRRSRPYTELRDEALELLSRLPVIGGRVENILERLADSVQSALTPGGLFVELGWNYYGPVNGHDIDEMIASLESLKSMEGPTLLHVVTEKGHGFAPAKEDPTAYHSSKPFELKDGTVIRKTAIGARPSFTKVFGDKLLELGEREKRIMVITAAMPDGTGTRAFGEKFPERFWDVGICEQHGVGLASGLAASGCIPVAAIYSTFLQRANDQLFHDISLQGAPVIFCIDRAGLVGSDGVSHHGLYDIAYMRYLPGFVLMAPRDGTELEMMLEWAVEADRPCAIRYPRDSVPDDVSLQAEREPIVMGRSEMLESGTDVALLGYGISTEYARAAASILAADGVSAGVVNARFAKPVDIARVSSLLESYRLVVTLEEHALAGGFGSAVLEACADAGVDGSKIRRIGVPDEFIDHAPRSDQLSQVGLSPESAAERVTKWLT